MKDIGQIVRVDSTLNWLVEVFRKRDVETPPDRTEYSFGTFVKTPLEDIELISVIRDVVIYNPDYGVPQVKAEEREEIEKLMPDIGDQVRTLVYVYYLGDLRDGNPDHTFPNLNPEIHDNVSLMSDEEVRKFHKKDENLYLGYLDRLMSIENSSYLFLNMAERIGKVIDFDEGLFRKIKNDINTRTKIGEGGALG